MILECKNLTYLSLYNISNISQKKLCKVLGGLKFLRKLNLSKMASAGKKTLLGFDIYRLYVLPANTFLLLR